MRISVCPSAALGPTARPLRERIRVTRSGSSVTTRSISSASSPREAEPQGTLHTMSAQSHGPQDVRGSSVPLEQADPVDTATPSRSRAISKASASTPSKLMCWCQGCVARVPVDRGAGTPASTPASSRSRSAATRGPCSASVFRATRAAAPRPPRRYVLGTGPPVPLLSAAGHQWRSFVPRLTQSAPMPFARRACVPRATGGRRRALERPPRCDRRLHRICVKHQPASCASAANSATGWSVPTSLLACITVTRAVSGRMADASADGSTMPDASTGSRSRHSRGGRAPARCEAPPRVRSRLPPRAADHGLPRPPPLPGWRGCLPRCPIVNTTSTGSAPMSAATSSRASSSTALACWPK